MNVAPTLTADFLYADVEMDGYARRHAALGNVHVEFVGAREDAWLWSLLQGATLDGPTFQA